MSLPSPTAVSCTSREEGAESAAPRHLPTKQTCSCRANGQEKQRDSAPSRFCAISCEIFCRPEDGLLSHPCSFRMSCLVGCLRTAILPVLKCRPQQTTSRNRCNAIWQHSSVDASSVSRLPYAQAEQLLAVQINDLVSTEAKSDAVALQLLLMILCKGWCACVLIWVLRVVKRLYGWSTCTASGDIISPRAV